MAALRAAQSPKISTHAARALYELLAQYPNITLVTVPLTEESKETKMPTAPHRLKPDYCSDR